MRAPLQSKKTSKTLSGFTLIELTFAVAFISVLLLTITLIVNEIIGLYRKGYSLKTVNQVGRSLIEEFSDGLTQASSLNVSSLCRSIPGSSCQSDNGFKLIYQQINSSTAIDTKDVSGGDTGSTTAVPVGGILCTGKYSYIWNTGYVLSNDYGITGQRLYITTSDGTLSNFRLLKVEDVSRSACRTPITASNNYNNPRYTTTYNGATVNGLSLSDFSNNDFEELLQNSDSSVVLYNFAIAPPAESSDHNFFYSASFVLGTLGSGVNIMTNSNFCQTSDYNNLDFSYCAVNKFNFSTHSSGN